MGDGLASSCDAGLDAFSFPLLNARAQVGSGSAAGGKP